METAEALFDLARRAPRTFGVILLLAGSVSLLCLAPAQGADSATPPPLGTTPRISLVNAETGASAFTIQANGPVRAVEGDGAGSFYVGGQYSCIGPTARSVTRASQCVAPNTKAYGLVRLRPDGSVDPAFIPVIEGDAALDEVMVIDIARVGSTVYFVGSFWGVNGAFRTGAAAIADDGGLTSWAPRFDSQPIGIYANDRGNLFLFGGGFESVNGQPTGNAGNLVEITPAGEWSGFRASGVYGEIEGVAELGGKTYLAGTLFSGSKNQTKRRQAAALDGNGRLTGWNPSFGGTKRPSTYSIERVGELLVFGGDFRKAQGKPRRGLAGFDASGRLTSWAPRLSGSDAAAYDISSIGSTAYVVGTFDRVNTARRANAAAINSAGQVTPWLVKIPGGGDWSPVIGGSQGNVLIGLWKF